MPRTKQPRESVRSLFTSVNPYATIRRSRGREMALPMDIWIPPTPRAAMNAQTTASRNYAQLDRFNTNTEKLFKLVVTAEGTAVNTPVIKDIQLPIQTLPDGTAIVPEIIKCVAYWMQNAATTAIESQSFYLFIDGPGVETPANVFRNDSCIIGDRRIHSFDHTVGEAYDVEQLGTTIYDLTDGNGNGYQITQNPTLYFVTGGWDAPADFALHIFYKQRMLTTAAYVSQRSYQRGGNR